MNIELIITIIATIVSLTGVYWVLRMDLELLKQKVDSHKSSTDETINRLIKSLDKLELTIEKLTEKIDSK